MTPDEKTAAIYKKMHKDREAHIEHARRARDLSARLAELTDRKREDRMTIMAMASVTALLLASTVFVYYLTQVPH